MGTSGKRKKKGRGLAGTVWSLWELAGTGGNWRETTEEGAGTGGNWRELAGIGGSLWELAGTGGNRRGKGRSILLPSIHSLIHSFALSASSAKLSVSGFPAVRSGPGFPSVRSGAGL